MAKRFDQQIAWITGGGTGIGRALAEQLAAGVRRHLDTALDTPVAEPLPVAPVSPWPACLRLLVALLLVAAVIAAWALRSS